MLEPMSCDYNDSLKIYDVEFPSKGKLEQQDGFLYVKIPDDIRDTIFQSLKNDPDRMSPSLKDRAHVPSARFSLNDVGAHVSILDLREGGRVPQEKLEKFIEEQTNTEITFDRIIGIKKLAQTAASEHLWVLELESKQLESLRVDQLGLEPQPNYGRFNFHVTIADIPWVLTGNADKPPSEKGRFCPVM